MKRTKNWKRSDCSVSFCLSARTVIGCEIGNGMSWKTTRTWTSLSAVKLKKRTKEDSLPVSSWPPRGLLSPRYLSPINCISTSPLHRPRPHRPRLPLLPFHQRRPFCFCFPLDFLWNVAIPSSSACRTRRTPRPSRSPASACTRHLCARCSPRRDLFKRNRKLHKNLTRPSTINNSLFSPVLSSASVNLNFGALHMLQDCLRDQLTFAHWLHCQSSALKRPLDLSAADFPISVPSFFFSHGVAFLASLRSTLHRWQ